MDEKFKQWQNAFGINEKDGTTPSYFLQSLAEANIIGMITDAEAEKLLLKYLEENNLKSQYINDLVTLRIKRFLTIDMFSLSQSYLYAIHKYIFAGVWNHNGITRTTGISRREPCIEDATVIYATPQEIQSNLKYDFAVECSRNYNGKSIDYIIRCLAKFISNIWQTHPFNDGNTRTVSVFLEKYLNHLGYPTNNELFKNNSLYFRNALVRSNPTTCDKIKPTDEYLYRFFEKILINPSLSLDVEEMNISYSR